MEEYCYCCDHQRRFLDCKEDPLRSEINAHRRYQLFWQLNGELVQEIRKLRENKIICTWTFDIDHEIVVRVKIVIWWCPNGLQSVTGQGQSVRQVFFFVEGTTIPVMSSLFNWVPDLMEDECKWPEELFNPINSIQTENLIPFNNLHWWWCRRHSVFQLFYYRWPRRESRFRVRIPDLRCCKRNGIFLTQNQ